MARKTLVYSYEELVGLAIENAKKLGYQIDEKQNHHFVVDGRSVYNENDPEAIRRGYIRSPVEISIFYIQDPPTGESK